MVIWKNTDSVKYGVAICRFNVAGQHYLPLNIGDSVLIYEETDSLEWFRGCLLLNRTIKGIFPANYVHVKRSIDSENTDDAASSKELLVVAEITSVLREWGDIWKQWFVKNSPDTEKLKKLLVDLMNWRRYIMSGTLTSDQLKQMKLQIASEIDYGNKFLGLDLVVRDVEGNVIDDDSIGVVDLYKRHVESSERLNTPLGPNKSPRIGSGTNQYNEHCLFVCIKHLVCNIGDDAEVIITLYDGMQNAFISENFVIPWSKQGMPKDIKKLHNLSCLFMDLDDDDLNRDKVYVVCQIVRDGRMDSKENDTKKLTKSVRRPFALAVLFVSDILKGVENEDEDKEIGLQLQLINNEDVETMIKKYLSRLPLMNAAASGQGIWLTVNLLHGDYKQVKEENPLKINNYTEKARKIGFLKAIMPGDIRNDMYITLISGTFDKSGKSTHKNIQVQLSVFTPSGQLMNDVVSYGSGKPLVNEYNSTVFYHTPNPKWGEVVKLAIPIENVEKVGSHVRFSFRHRATKEEQDKSQKVFSMSYVHLISPDGTCLQDGVHELAVYKTDCKKFDDNHAYLQLPSFKAEAAESTNKKIVTTTGSFTYSKSETFKIAFQLCSTKLAQNVNLLALLKWRHQKDRLKTILPALMNVSGQEIVKFLQDVFDALFAILTEDPAEYGEMVSDALVFCIGLLADEKYQQFRSILDAYIEKLFSSTKAYITLIEVVQQNIEKSKSLDLSKEFREHIMKYFKTLEYLMKFIVRSRMLSERAAPGKGRQEFEGFINSLMSSIITMQRMDTRSLLPLQGCALKYVPPVFGDLLAVYDAVQLGYFAKDLIESTPANRLQTQKLTTIHSLVKSPLFTNFESRKIILPMIVTQVKSKIQEFEELKICADILNVMLGTFYLDESIMGEKDEDIGFIVLNFYQLFINTITGMNLSSTLVGNYIAFILSLLDLMKEEHYLQYVNSYESHHALLVALVESFLVFQQFLKNEFYSKDWVSMIMIQNSVISGALTYFSDVLYDRFLVGDSFSAQLWDIFFHVAVAFITQESLQLETFSESKRNKIIEKYSDMRIVMGKKVVDLWGCLGINKINLLQNMVLPFLEMTLIPQTELREATIPIFYDMIQAEFKDRQHFKQVESEVIIHLDDLIESGGKGDEEFKDLFSRLMLEKLSQDQRSYPGLYEAGTMFVKTITQLISRLLDYRSVIQSEDNINNRMSCTVNILNFYQAIKREEMKERYLYKLCDLHLSVDDYTEAAFTLLQHANMLKWSDEPLSNANTNITSSRYEVSTQRQLKEKLYKDIIDYFEKGKMWEYGISRCKELAKQYETETYDYVKLSETLKKEADFFKKIIQEIRLAPTYFKVSYYGRGFPTFLRNKSFIYRGNEAEGLGDFNMRMKAQFPGAQFLTSLDAPGTDVTEAIGQYLQIVTVKAKPVERRKFNGKNIANQIMKFYEVNDVNAFELKRSFHKGKKNKENEFATLWVVKTNMTTEDTFPGKLRWFEIRSSTTTELSPLQNAVESLHEKNLELNTLIRVHRADPSIALNPFTMLLNGVIDAAVAGGISRFEEIFFTSEYIKNNPDDGDLINDLKKKIVEQIDILEKGLQLHKQLISADMEALHKKMEGLFQETKQRVAPYRRDRLQTAGFSRQVQQNSVLLHHRGDGRAGSVLLSRGTISGFPSSGPKAIRATVINDGNNQRGFRNTTIIGPSSPNPDLVSPNLPEDIPPPLPGRERDTFRFSKVAPTPVSNSSPSVVRRAPPTPPPYSPKNSPRMNHSPELPPKRRNSNRLSNNDSKDEDEQPPELPARHRKPTVQLTNSSAPANSSTPPKSSDEPSDTPEQDQMVNGDAPQNDTSSLEDDRQDVVEDAPPLPPRSKKPEVL